jgi:hypothetical protein
MTSNEMINKGLRELIDQEIVSTSQVAQYGTKGNGKFTEPGAAVISSCKNAAEMIRGIHKAHAEQCETTATHLEKLGEDLTQMCQEAAATVRALTVMPQEMADTTASDLVDLGDRAAKRQAQIVKGLMAAREALLAIDEVVNEAPQ